MKRLLVSICFAAIMTPSLNANSGFEGGIVIHPKSFKGKALVLNSQTIVDQKEIELAASLLAKYSECNVVAQRGESVKNLSAAKQDYNAELVVVVVSDGNTPAMLLAPEDGWGYVNVMQLTNDLRSEKAKKKFLPSRTRKEIIRAFSILAGGGSSQFDGNLMNASTIRETDFMEESIPVDIINYWQRHLKSLGITKKVSATYLDACEQGWAPAPTNDVQKAIWDKVHAAPKSPMKIEFDPKKGR